MLGEWYLPPGKCQAISTITEGIISISHPAPLSSQTRIPQTSSPLVDKSQATQAALLQIRRSESTQSCQLGESLFVLLGLPLPKQFRIGRSWRHDVDRDAPQTQLFGKDVRQLLHGTLGGNVSAIGRQHHGGRGRREIDDPPSICHSFGCLLAREERPFNVDGEVQVVLLLCDIRKRFVEHDACVVDEDVELAEMLEGGV